MSHLGPMMPPEPVERVMYTWWRHRSRCMYDERTVLTECGSYLTVPWEPDTLDAEIVECPDCFPPRHGDAR